MIAAKHYIGDVFEENARAAAEIAASLRLRGTRVIVLHDRNQAPELDRSAETFQLIAKITRGAVLPFEATATTRLREVLEAIATLAVGGTKLLAARSPQLLAANVQLALLPQE
jgi:cytosine/adenosine deaminase-related metal-dependent hydrolase